MNNQYYMLYLGSIVINIGTQVCLSRYIFYPLMTWIREAVFDMDTCGAFLLKIQGKSLSRLDATFMVTVPKNSSILYIMSEQKHTLIISTKPNSKILK